MSIHFCCIALLGCVCCCVCFRDAYLTFFQSAFGYTRASDRPVSPEKVDLKLLGRWIVNVNELVFGTTVEGFDREVRYTRDTHGVDVMELTTEDPWPIGCSLVLPSDKPRPGSFVITLDAPLGGRVASALGVQFGSFAVSLLLELCCLGTFFGMWTGVSACTVGLRSGPWRKEPCVCGRRKYA